MRWTPPHLRRVPKQSKWRIIVSTGSRSVWFSGPRTVELRPDLVKDVGDGDVRVHALCSGISHGSELLIYRGEVPENLLLDLTILTMQGSFGFPVKYGYASVGTVTGFGRSVSGLNEGDTVFAFHPHQTEYVVGADYVVRLNSDLDPRVGVFLASLETALNAVLDAAPRIGERVGIIGQGVIGLLITQLVRRMSPALLVTSDVFEKRRSLSVLCGADSSVGPDEDELLALVMGATGASSNQSEQTGLDLVFEVTGNPRALTEAIHSVGAEGRVIVVSWYGARKAAIDLGDRFHRRRVTIRSSQVSRLDPVLLPRWTLDRRRKLAAHYLEQLRLKELITHRFPFDAAADAYKLIDSSPGDVVQVVIDY